MKICKPVRKNVKNALCFLTLFTVLLETTKHTEASEEHVKTFEIGSVKYHFDLRYLDNKNISSKKLKLLSIAVDYKTFEPEGGSLPCFSQGINPKCKNIRFSIIAPRAKNVEQTNELKGLDLYPTDRIQEGYSVYEVGISGNEVFIKKAGSKNYVFFCYKNNLERPNQSVCSSYAVADQGGLVEFHFPLAILGDASRIKDEMLDFVNAHTCTKENSSDKFCS